jgi:protein phosphatase
MATTPARLKFTGASDIGRVRQGNEDAIAWDEALGLALLADGMGGYEGGEVASNLAVSAVLDVFRQPLAPHWREAEWTRNISDPILKLYAAVSQANQTVYEAAQQQPEHQGMGTTLLAAYFHDNRVTLAHIGDSRIFLWRNRALSLLTIDHTVIQQQIDNGEITREEAPYSEHRGILTRALGVDPVVEVDMREVASQSGDIFLLCSDGCYDMLTYDEMVAILDANRDDAQDVARLLVHKANENGGFDNISAVVARVL